MRRILLLVYGGASHGGDDGGHGDTGVRHAPAVWSTGDRRTSHLHRSGACLPGFRVC
jgi:hypothetical protein